MPNILEFALGLQTSEFLDKLGFASEEILSLAGLADVVREAWDHTWEAMAKGAELQALSSATGQSVKNLYEFEHGLEAIGGQTQSLPMFFMLMQKALSGVNDAGQRTSITFTALGLDINKLRAEDTVKAITDVAGALNKLNPTQAAGVAESLFGRFQAQSVLEIARNMEMFQGGMGEASNTGALLDKFAKTFEQVKADWSDILGDVTGVWVSVGGAIGPELHKIFLEVHDSVKNLGPALYAAVQGGHVEELLTASIEAAGEQGLNYLEAGLAAAAVGFGEGMYQAMAIAIHDIIPMLMHMATEVDMAEKFLAAAALGKITGNKKMASDAQDALKGLAELGTKSFGTDMKKAFSDIMSGASIGGDVKDVWADMLKNAAHGKKDSLDALISRLAAAGVAGNNSSGSGAGAPSIGGLTENHYRPEFTSLEKMGFVMRGGASHEQEKIGLLRIIAYNTSLNKSVSNYNSHVSKEIGGYNGRINQEINQM